MLRTLQWGSCHAVPEGHLEALRSIGTLAAAYKQTSAQEGAQASHEHLQSQDNLLQLCMPSMRVEGLTELLSEVTARMVQMERRVNDQQQLLALMEFAAHIQSAIWGIEDAGGAAVEKPECRKDTDSSIRWDGEVLAHNLACVRQGLDDFFRQDT
jgi:hypothetical protein